MLAAPIYQVSPLMGANLIIVVFAVVVIGGMGSIMGSIVTGFGLGLIEGLTKVFYPEASNTVIFVIMAIVLLIKPAGLFGRARPDMAMPLQPHDAPATTRAPPAGSIASRSLIMLAFARRRRRSSLYPVFLMKVLCFALFACAFNLLLGYVGLLSFGHAAFLGMAGYVSGACGQGLGLAAGARHPRRRPSLPLRSASSSAALAIRRQGIYFAMITLALAQMVYFFCAAGAVHRRRGRHPGGAARPALRPRRPRRTTWRCTTSCSRSSWSASC